MAFALDYVETAVKCGAVSLRGWCATSTQQIPDGVEQRLPENDTDAEKCWRAAEEPSGATGGPPIWSERLVCDGRRLGDTTRRVLALVG